MKPNMLQCALALLLCLPLQGKGQDSDHTLRPGLVMAGYQGWFNTPSDGAERGWYHYSRDGKFEPGYCTVDLWPDTSEYEKTYRTPFSFADGSPAYVFSSHDSTTVDLHFKWMAQYGLDGVFMQRFAAEIKNVSGERHFTKVLGHAFKSAERYDRTLAVMYDLSGIKTAEIGAVKEDWKKLLERFRFDQRSEYANYLFHEGRPVVAIWGVGFNDGRNYDLEDVAELIRFFQSDQGGSCSILLGVPTYWREQGKDCTKDPKFHEILQMADILHPWFVGRYDSNSYEGFRSLIGKDQAWCDEHGLRYMPVVFPGFSWNNMHPDAKQSSVIARNGGRFLWKQLSGAVEEGAQMIYVSMFDEIDEGTAIFKIGHKVPVGESEFLPMEEGLGSDHYLWLTGQAAKFMKAGRKIPEDMPKRE